MSIHTLTPDIGGITTVTMKTLIVFASLVGLALCSVGPHGGAVVSGPSGVVTNHGAIGPNGLPNGALGGHGGIIGAGIGGVGLGGLGVGQGAALVAPVATAVISGPALGHGLGLGAGIGLGGWGGLGGGWGVGPAVAAGPALGVASIGHGIVTNGGGTIGLSGHGVTVSGPPTAPAVIAGPSGRVAADGLWGPTAHWATAGHGHGAHGW